MQRRSVRSNKAWLAAGLIGLVAAFGMAGCSKDSPEVKACKKACPIEVVPVCGASGTEYTNYCHAKCANETFTEGVCSVGAPKTAAPAEGGGATE